MGRLPKGSRRSHIINEENFSCRPGSIAGEALFLGGEGGWVAGRKLSKAPSLLGVANANYMPRSAPNFRKGRKE